MQRLVRAFCEYDHGGRPNIQTGEAGVAQERTGVANLPSIVSFDFLRLLTARGERLLAARI